MSRIRNRFARRNRGTDPEFTAPPNNQPLQETQAMDSLPEPPSPATDTVALPEDPPTQVHQATPSPQAPAQPAPAAPTPAVEPEPQTVVASEPPSQPVPTPTPPPASAEAPAVVPAVPQPPADAVPGPAPATPEIEAVSSGRRLRPRRKSKAAVQAAAADHVETASFVKRPSARERGKLRRRLRHLRQVRELGYRDLGGLVFELYKAAQRNDVLVQAKLDALGRINKELQALERDLNDFHSAEDVHEPGVSICRACGALIGSDAKFCHQCATPVSAKRAKKLRSSDSSSEAPQS